MRVFNLTKTDHVYKGRTIPPNGGSLEYGEIFVPDRDLALEKAGILAFGKLPTNWKPAAPIQILQPSSTVEVKPVVETKLEAVAKVVEAGKIGFKELDEGNKKLRSKRE